MVTLESEDMLDIRDLWERMQNIQANDDPDEDDLDDLVELNNLSEQFDGGLENQADMDPTLICYSYFKTYAQELADEIGATADSDAQWPYTYIDWEGAARELKMDYTSVEFLGVTYYVHC